ncbi:hypothetical protein CCO03_10680 [Comamonas serinivorans]|uniref:Acyl-CoA dehydrogenase n=1 Tax=Comamonas serinivorans TaxID=1082851 RepID=A0A1Y0EP74_9BURK|nr:acyl-CoA dehydrogenase family protein [Comamonas serinivorans]ARU05092.1 hypothetical protein CCO03_10680 [Comamonas serinivorans]
MSWNLDESQTMLRDSARSFVTEQQPIAVLRKLRDTGDALGYSPEAWKTFADLGYAGMLVPEAQGGLGLQLRDAALVAEQLGHTLAPLPYLSTAVLAAWVLNKGQNQALKAQWLPRIAAADTVLAVAIDEAARPGAALTTVAKKQGDGYVVTGHKQLVIDGHAAEALLVAARDADDANSVVWLWVARDAQGVQTERVAMLDAHLTARVQLQNVAVAADGVIASGQAGAQLLASVLDVGRLMTAAELVGVGDEVFARTLEYLKQRKQFGKLIGEFQALQHRAAELYCDLELSRAMVWSGLQAVDEQAADAPLRVAQAKARASLSTNRAALEGVQMHGGMGMTDELDFGLFLKRARALQALFGDAHQMLDRMAQLKGY